MLASACDCKLICRLFVMQHVNAFFKNIGSFLLIFLPRRCVHGGTS